MYREPRRIFVEIIAWNGVSSDLLNGGMNLTRGVIGQSVGFISLILNVVIEPQQDPASLARKCWRNGVER